MWRGTLSNMDLDPNISSEECKKKFTASQKVEQLYGMNVEAESIAVTEHPYSKARFLVLGKDKSLWAWHDNKDNDNMFKKLNIELK